MWRFSATTGDNKFLTGRRSGRPYEFQQNLARCVSRIQRGFVIYATLMVEGQKVRRMFAGIARRYDFLNHLLSCHVDKLWRRRTVQLSQVQKSDKVLDICAGTGDLSFAFARKGAKVIGADFCSEMILLADQKRKDSSYPYNGSPRFAVADSLALPFQDRQFDVVSVAFGIRNLEDWKKGVAEMRRVTRPGGRILILEFAQPKNALVRKLYFFYFLKVLPRVGRWVSGDKEAYQYLPDSVMRFVSPDEIAQEMQKLGFKSVTVERLSAGVAALVVGTRPPES